MEQNQAAGESTTATLLKPSKTKAKKETAVVDPLLSTATEIENLTETEAREKLNALRMAEGMNDYNLGGVMAVQQTNQWKYEFESFKEYIETEVGMKYRKAMYLIGNYKALVEADIQYPLVQEIGWTKLTVIASILTKDNVAEWVEKAKKYTVLQLRAMVEALSKAQSNAEKGPDMISEVTTLTFKIHPDQKVVIREALDKAKAEGNTEFDTVALEKMCSAYLGGAIEMPAQGEAKDLKTLMQEAGFETVLVLFDQLFPDVNLTIEQ